MLFRDAVAIALQEMTHEVAMTAQLTWKSHAKGALAYWGEFRDVRTLTRAEIQSWIDWRSKTAKTSTIIHERCFLSRLWRVLEDRALDLGFRNPFQRLRMPRLISKKRRIEPEVIDALLLVMSDPDRDLVQFALLTFLRRLELFRLQTQHITLWVDEQGQLVGRLLVVTSKTGKPRTVLLSPAAALIAKRRIEAVGCEPEAYLFGTQRPERYHEACGWAKRSWVVAQKKAGVRGEFHGLRHAGAHRAWRNGAPIESISLMLGHRTLVQTQHYLGVTEDAMWPAARAAALGLVFDPPDPPAEPRADLVEPTRPPEPPTALQPATLLAPQEWQHNKPKATDWIFSM